MWKLVRSIRIGTLFYLNHVSCNMRNIGQAKHNCDDGKIIRIIKYEPAICVTFQGQVEGKASKYTGKNKCVTGIILCNQCVC